MQRYWTNAKLIDQSHVQLSSEKLCLAADWKKNRNSHSESMQRGRNLGMHISKWDVSVKFLV